VPAGGMTKDGKTAGRNDQPDESRVGEHGPQGVPVLSSFRPSVLN